MSVTREAVALRERSTNVSAARSCSVPDQREDDRRRSDQQPVDRARSDTPHPPGFRADLERSAEIGGFLASANQLLVTGKKPLPAAVS